MKILPTPVEEFVNGTDNNRSLAFGISGIGWSPVSLVVPIVLWGAIGVASAVAASAFLTRYAKQT